MSGTGTAVRAAVLPARLSLRWLVAGVVAVVVAALAGLAIGPVAINPLGVVAELLNLIPGVDIHTGLSGSEAAIVTQLRLPRVALGLLVGAMLALAVASVVLALWQHRRQYARAAAPEEPDF